MTDVMITEKDRLTQTLSDQYSKNIININEYEKMLDLVNKVETVRDVMVIEKMSKAYSDMVIPEQRESAPAYAHSAKLMPKTKNTEYTSIFSNREVVINPESGKAGTFTSVFGNMDVKVAGLSEGRTKLLVEAVFGNITIYVPAYVRVKTNVTPVFGSVSSDNDSFPDSGADDRPELYIKGEAVFGNISIKRLTIF